MIGQQFAKRMTGYLMHNIVLRIQARTGVTSTFFIGSATAACALLVVFVFLCVTGYAWLSVQLGAVFGGLAMAGIFLLVALVGIAAAAVSRRQAKQRAILEQAAGPLKLLHPKVLSVAMQAGRALAGSVWSRWLCSVFWPRNGCSRPDSATPTTNLCDTSILSSLGWPARQWHPEGNVIDGCPHPKVVKTEEGCAGVRRGKLCLTPPGERRQSRRLSFGFCGHLPGPTRIPERALCRFK